jgi:hypothetical protein
MSTALISELLRLVRAHDYLRSGVSSGSGVDDKEWHHFCVLAPDVDLIVNFSLSADTRLQQQVGRIVLLVRERSTDAWDGDIDSSPRGDVQARRGEIPMRIGSSTLGWGPGGYELSVVLQERPITARLSLLPRTLPLLARADAVMGEGRLSWLLVPRLSATGRVVVGRRTYLLDQAPSYHDHNWGHWRWGQDFAWQWGFGLPDDRHDPWSVVFQRMTDRPRNSTLEMLMALWRDDKLHRLFHPREITVHTSGLTPARSVLKLPRVLRLLAPEQTSDVPAQLLISARSGGDHVRLTFETLDLAQIVVPHETDLGMTMLNEVRGRIHLDGEVKGHEINSAGVGVFEFLT